MKEFVILVGGIALGMWIKTNIEERKALKKENEILKSKIESKE